MFFRRRPKEEDPLAALRGDGSTAFGNLSAGTAPAAPAQPTSEPPPQPGRTGRIIARFDTGVALGGVPRLRLTVEIAGGSTRETVVVVPPGMAAEVGDTVDIADDGTPRLRPKMRPPG